MTKIVCGPSIYFDFKEDSLHEKNYRFLIPKANYREVILNIVWKMIDPKEKMSIRVYQSIDNSALAPCKWELITEKYNKRLSTFMSDPLKASAENLMTLVYQNDLSYMALDIEFSSKDAPVITQAQALLIDEGNKIRFELQKFTELMEEKLQQNDYKGGWKNCNTQQLLSYLKGETLELEQAIIDGNKENIVKEAADVANFAMMIADIEGK